MVGENQSILYVLEMDYWEDLSTTGKLERLHESVLVNEPLDFDETTLLKTLIKEAIEGEVLIKIAGDEK